MAEIKPLSKGDRNDSETGTIGSGIWGRLFVQRATMPQALFRWHSFFLKPAGRFSAFWPAQAERQATQTSRNFW
jgi:hypothetical protein